MLINEDQMKLQSLDRTVWYCGTDTETRVALKKVLLEQPPLVAYTSFGEVLRALETNEPPALLVVDLKPGEAEQFLTSFSTHFELQNRTLLLVDDLSLPSVRKLCAETACELLLKPIAHAELAVRIERVFRTPLLNARVTLELLHSFGAELTSTEVKLLFCFLASETRTVTREQIMTLLWSGLSVHPRTFDVHLFNLRKKLIEKGLQILSDRGGRWTLAAAKPERKTEKDLRS